MNASVYEGNLSMVKEVTDPAPRGALWSPLYSDDELWQPSKIDIFFISNAETTVISYTSCINMSTVS